MSARPVALPNEADLPPCPCGKPWGDLARFDETQRAFVEMTVRQFGEDTRVTIGTRTWAVSRRCIAYHGITGPQLLSGTSGFKEIVTMDVDEVQAMILRMLGVSDEGVH
jgi:hypothetical protein